MHCVVQNLLAAWRGGPVEAGPSLNIAVTAVGYAQATQPLKAIESKPSSVELS
jgi:hypothetical protein